MARQLDPDRSFSHACRHFFRYLFDARELERNPLVRRDRASVGELDRLPARVRAAADECRRDDAAAGYRELAERRYRILIEHALAKRAAPPVARELGVSLRQFYRDRNHAYDHVVQKLFARPQPPERRVATALDAHELAVGQARFLVANARYEEALRIWSSIAERSAGVDRRTDAFAAMAEVSCRQNRHDEARRNIERGTALCASSGNDGDDIGSATSRAVLDVAAAAYCLDMDRYAEAATFRTRALARLRPTDARSDDRVKATTVRALVLNAHHLAVCGRHTAALEQLRTATAIVDAMTIPIALIRIDLLLEHASVLMSAVGGDVDAARKMIGDALLLAQQFGYAVPAIAASSAHAFDEAIVRGRCGPARRTLQACRHVALALGDAKVIASCDIDMAGLEVSCGNFAVADAILDDPGVLVAPRGPDAVNVHFYRAESRRRQGRYADALRAAQTTRTLADRLESPRLTSAVEREIAQSYAALGRASHAFDHISEALELGERYGSATSLALTYEASAKITNNRSHARRAESIRKSVEPAGRS